MCQITNQRIMNQNHMNQKILKIALGLIMLITSQLFISQSVFAKTPAPDKAQKITKASIQPFGNNLFTGSFQSQRNDGLDPNYRLVPGDKVALHMWGQVTIDETLTVDASGNIFIPEVGQVKVAGLRSSALSRVVKQKVATVFKEVKMFM